MWETTWALAWQPYMSARVGTMSSAHWLFVDHWFLQCVPHATLNPLLYSTWALNQWPPKHSHIFRDSPVMPKKHFWLIVNSMRALTPRPHKRLSLFGEFPILPSTYSLINTPTPFEFFSLKNLREALLVCFVSVVRFCMIWWRMRSLLGGTWFSSLVLIPSSYLFSCSFPLDTIVLFEVIMSVRSVRKPFVTLGLVGGLLGKHLDQMTFYLNLIGWTLDPKVERLTRVVQGNAFLAKHPTTPNLCSRFVLAQV